MCIHPVFHVWLLEPYKANKIPERTQPLPPLEAVDGGLKYEVEKVLDL
jgi:hypothetical protein